MYVRSFDPSLYIDRSIDIKGDGLETFIPCTCKASTLLYRDF